MSKVLIAVDDLNLVHDLESQIDEMQGIDVVGVVTTSRELRTQVERTKPQLVLVSELLGPEPVESVIRDLVTQFPATAVVEIVANRTPQHLVRAMEAGARGVLASPLVYEEVAERIGRAIEFAEQMDRAILGAQVHNRSKGMLVTVVGAKGGVGTTTLAVHLASDQLRQHPEQTVCVVDLDVEKGDVAAMLDIRQTVSIADVARVSGDFSVNTVLDAVIHHESGLRVLLAPNDVREAELVTADSVRAILEILRREYDMVVVDGGGHVSPTQAAAVELADSTMVVTTADALAMRCFRKRAIAWESLGVRDESELKVLVNKVDKAAIFPVSAVPRLTVAKVLDSSIPYTPRAIETASNDRDPRAVTEVAWWRLMNSIRSEIGMARDTDEPRSGGRLALPRRKGRRRPAADVAPAPGQAAMEASRGPGADLLIDERGAVAIENVAILPLVLLLAVLGWQAAVVGLTMLYDSHAVSSAARTYAATGSTELAARSARETVPGPFKELEVSASDSRVTVRMHVPMSLGQAARFMDHVSTSEDVVMER